MWWSNELSRCQCQCATPPVRTRSWVTSLSGTSSCCWHGRNIILYDGSKNSATRQLVTKLGCRHGLHPVDSVIPSYETQKINNYHIHFHESIRKWFLLFYKNKKLCYPLYWPYFGIFRIFVLNLLSFQRHVHSIRNI